MADLATVSDVEALWHTLSDEELERTEAMLGYASRMVRARFPNIDQRIARCKIDPQLVTDVVATMVIRAMRNPTGLSQETIGPVSYSVSQQVAAGYLFLGADEVAMLTPAGAPGSAAGGSSVGTIKLKANL